MLLNRALSIKLVKTTPGNKKTPETTTPVDASDLAHIAMYHAPQAAQILGALYVGKKVVDTACQIAVIAAQNRL